MRVPEDERSPEEHRFVGKTKMYQEHIRSPMFIRYPRLIPLRRTEARFALNIHVGPTLAELAGVSPSSPTDGQSLVRVLDGTVDLPRFSGRLHYAAML